MKQTILLVDDEQLVLASYRRILQKDFQVMTALGGLTAIEILEKKGPFPVVITDMRMPGMNGTELLSHIKEMHPDTTRIMLSGQADFNTAIEAVNEGNIFRFLTKPCQPDHLIKVINDGIRQYELIKTEHELLNKTLQGSIKILIEILSMIDQNMFSKALKLRNTIRNLSQNKIISGGWEIEISALLAQIGVVTIPDIILKKLHRKEALSDTEKSMVEKVPQIGHDLIIHIPRLSQVAKIILYQSKNFDGSGLPVNDVKGTQIPLASRIFKIVNDFNFLLESGLKREQAIENMNKKYGIYDPSLLNVVLNENIFSEKQNQYSRKEIMKIALKDIKAGVYLADNLETNTNQLLVIAGQEITNALLLRIHNWAKIYKIKEPITVYV